MTVCICPVASQPGVFLDTPRCSYCGVFILNPCPYTAEQAETKWRPKPHDDYTQRQLVYIVILTGLRLSWGRRWLIRWATWLYILCWHLELPVILAFQVTRPPNHQL